MFETLKESVSMIFGSPNWTEKDIPDLNDKVYIVTGGTAGIGYEATRYLVQAGARVYIFARSQSKVDETIEKILSDFPDGQVDFLLGDLADLPTIKPAIGKFLEQETELHGLILNAGIMTPPEGSKTKQGYELQLGVNCIGHWVIARLLLDVLDSTAEHSPANSVRVVFVSSVGHQMAPPGGMDWNDPITASGIGRICKYGQSKAINIQQAFLVGKKHPNLVALSCHPGVNETGLSVNSYWYEKQFFKMIKFKPNWGAYVELYAALHPRFTTEHSGTYVRPFETDGIIREDIKEAALDERGEKLEQWLNSVTNEYI